MRQVSGGGALRALAPSPALLGAAEALHPLPGHAFAERTDSRKRLGGAQVDRPKSKGRSRPREDGHDRLLWGAATEVRSRADTAISNSPAERDRLAKADVGAMIGEGPVQLKAHVPKHCAQICRGGSRRPAQTVQSDTDVAARRTPDPGLVAMTKITNAAIVVAGNASSP